MSKIAVLVCCNSGIDYIKHPYYILVPRSRIIFSEKEEYRDYVDIKADEFYDKLRKDPNVVPRTVQATTGEFVEMYEKVKADGYDTVIVILISSKMSGYITNANLAAQMVEGLHVVVFDSRSLGYIETRMALDASEMAKEGKSLDEIMKRLEYIRDNNHVFFAVEDLKFLVKNGRLSGAAGFIGGMLKIKPLLEIDNTGQVVSLEKIRTFQKAVDRVIEKYLEATEGKAHEAFIIHAHNIECAEYIRKKILESRPELKEVPDFLLTPVVGAHCGPGAISVGFILKNEKENR